MLHFLWLIAHLAPAIMSPDANGYVAQGRLLAEEGRTSFSPTSPAQYVGMHWLETTDGVFHSRYPAGLPLLFAAAWKIGGLDAALFINPLLASATLLFVFLLGRRLMRESFAAIAAAVMATIPVVNQHALDADAHVAAMFFLTGGVWALLRFADTRAAHLGLLAGVMLGMIPTVRYPEAIIGLTVAAWLLWRVRPWAQTWPAVVGAALPIGVLCLHNASAYGAFWRTGYALTNEQTGFGLGYFAAHFLPYLQALGGQGLSLFFAFGTAGLAALAIGAGRRSEGLLFTGIVLPLVLLYMAYYFGGGPGAAGGNLRFLIPTFPFFAIAGAWLLAQMAVHLGRAGQAAVVVVIAIQGAIGIGTTVQTLTRAKSSLKAAAGMRALAEKEIPAGSVIILDRQLAESLDAVGGWKLVEESLLGGGPGAGFGRGGPGPGGRGGAFRPMGGELPGGGPDPDAPNPMQRGKNRAQQERYTGLGGEERRERVWADVVKWAGGKPIFWFARSLDAVENTLPRGADYRSIAETDTPTMFGPGGAGPGAQAPAGMAGGRGGRGPGGMAGPMGGPGGGGRPGMRGAMQGMPGGRGGPADLPSAKLRLVQITPPS